MGRDTAVRPQLRVHVIEWDSHWEDGIHAPRRSGAQLRCCARPELRERTVRGRVGYERVLDGTIKSASVYNIIWSGIMAYEEFSCDPGHGALEVRLDVPYVPSLTYAKR